MLYATNASPEILFWPLKLVQSIIFYSENHIDMLYDSDDKLHFWPSFQKTLCWNETSWAWQWILHQHTFEKLFKCSQCQESVFPSIPQGKENNYLDKYSVKNKWINALNVRICKSPWLTRWIMQQWQSRAGPLESPFISLSRCHRNTARAKDRAGETLTLH